VRGVEGRECVVVVVVVVAMQTDHQTSPRQRNTDLIAQLRNQDVDKGGRESSACNGQKMGLPVGRGRRAK
jgi:hypothetical protein